MDLNAIIFLHNFLGNHTEENSPNVISNLILFMIIVCLFVFFSKQPNRTLENEHKIDFNDSKYQHLEKTMRNSYLMKETSGPSI